MWIKHNHTLYNSDYISKIEITRTSLLKATFTDGQSEVIGRFRTVEECNNVLSNLTRALLFDKPDHPGIIIKDTKETKK